MSLESLDPIFHPDLLAKAHVKGCDEDFARVEVDPSNAFDPVPNIINTDSMLFNDPDVDSHMVEAMTLPRDRHIMCRSEENTEEFVERLYESLALVSSFLLFIVPHFLLVFG